MINRFSKRCKRGAKYAKDVVVKFTTDGCTLAPNFNFRECCEEHDQDYAKYHRTSEKNRAKSDRKLRLCIKCKGWAALSWIYWFFVRILGWIPFWVFKRRDKIRNNDGR